VWRRHARFQTLAFDLSIHDQAIWLMARGRSFLTVRGLHALGHHATFAYWLLAPLSWLGAGPQVWDLLQVLACALGAVPLYLLARTRMPRHPWVATMLGATWLLQPSLQFLVWETFHPEVMAATPVMAAYVAGVRRAWGWYAGFLGLALLWKEDVALVALMLGLLLLLGRQWRAGAITVAVGVAWLAFTVGFVVPASNGGRTFYGAFYGDLGRTPAEVLRTGVGDPGAIGSRLADNDAAGYAGTLLLPVGWSALAAPEVVAVGLPQAMVDLLSVQSFTHDRRYHYVVVPLVGIGLGAVEGVARLGRAAGRRARRREGDEPGGDGPRDRRLLRLDEGIVRPLALVVLAAAAWSSFAYGILPGSRLYDDGYWPRGSDPTVAVLRDAVARIPGHDGVSAGQRVLPHLSHRDVAYAFPNPWRPGPSTPYGVDDVERGDRAAVQWLLVDRRGLLRPQDTDVLDRVLASGAFAVVLDEQGILLAHRVEPPAASGGW
jgi:hypothetical protein